MPRPQLVGGPFPVELKKMEDRWKISGLIKDRRLSKASTVERRRLESLGLSSRGTASQGLASRLRLVRKSQNPAIPCGRQQCE